MARFYEITANAPKGITPSEAHLPPSTRLAQTVQLHAAVSCDFRSANGGTSLCGHRGDRLSSCIQRMRPWPEKLHQRRRTRLSPPHMRKSEAYKFNYNSEYLEVNTGRGILSQFCAVKSSGQEKIVRVVMGRIPLRLLVQSHKLKHIAKKGGTS